MNRSNLNRKLQYLVEDVRNSWWTSSILSSSDRNDSSWSISNGQQHRSHRSDWRFFSSLSDVLQEHVHSSSFGENDPYRKIVLTVEGNCRCKSLTSVSVSWKMDDWGPAYEENFLSRFCGKWKGVYHRCYVRILKRFNRIQPIVHRDLFRHDLSKNRLMINREYAG